MIAAIVCTKIAHSNSTNCHVVATTKGIILAASVLIIMAIVAVCILKS